MFSWPTLGNGYGLEPVQLSQQAGALRRVEAVNELLRSPGRVQGLHRLLEWVRAHVTSVQQPGKRGHSGDLVADQSGCGKPTPGSSRQGGPQDSPQAGQHLGVGERKT